MKYLIYIYIVYSVRCISPPEVIQHPSFGRWTLAVAIISICAFQWEKVQEIGAHFIIRNRTENGK